MAATSIIEHLLIHVAERPDEQALVYKKPSGEWVPLTWAELGMMVNRVARAFIAQGLASGQGVAILSDVRFEVNIVTLAAMMAGGRAVPIHPSADPDTIADLVHRSRSHIIMVEGKVQFRKLRNHMHLMPSLDTIIYLDEAGDNKKLLTWPQLMSRGEGFPETPLNLRIKDMAGDSPGALLYSPGTMGPIRGALLDQGRLIAGAKNIHKYLDVRPGQRLHTDAPPSGANYLLMGVTLPLISGATAFAPRGRDKLREDLRYIRPHFFIASPKTWDSLRVSLVDEGGILADVSPSVLDAAGSRAEALLDAKALGQAIPLGLKVKLGISKARVYGPVKEDLGLEQCLAPISTGSGLRASTQTFFRRLDFPILEGYGLVEAGGLVTLGDPALPRSGSVGTPLPSIELRLTDDGEICLKGDAIFEGYLRDSAATHLAIRDGWLHTGDLGALDPDGQLRIVERKRDAITTSNGRVLSPRLIEEGITELKELKRAMVASSGQDYLVAIIVLDDVLGMAWVKERKANVVTPRELARYRVFINYVQSHIDGLNAGKEPEEEIRKFSLLWRDFEEAKGEITPYGELRRSVLHGRFGEEIRSLYGDDYID